MHALSGSHHAAGYNPSILGGGYLWSRYNAVLEGDATSPQELFQSCAQHGQKWLVFSIDPDSCFYPEEQSELAGHLEAIGVDTIHITVHSDKGHDSFLLEPALYTPQISWKLSQRREGAKFPPKILCGN